MKVDAELILRLRRERAWSQDELALATGLNLRTIQRIETEATASLQSIKALASAFEVSIRALEHKESNMLSKLVGKEVQIVMGISQSMVSGFDDNVTGKIIEIEGAWLKLAQKKKDVFINIAHIKRIIPQ
jgi:transcriptional regulator with XRE-family HTH domain